MKMWCLLSTMTEDKKYLFISMSIREKCTIGGIVVKQQKGYHKKCYVPGHGVKV